MGIWTLAALLLMSGCDNKKNNKPNRGPNCSMKAGDIVITELMANPAGKDVQSNLVRIRQDLEASQKK